MNLYIYNFDTNDDYCKIFAYFGDRGEHRSWVASSSSFDGLGPLALFRINLKTPNLTERW
jgi:hypothetical protein